MAQASRFHILLNPNSGTVQALGLTAETLRQSFAAAGLTATVDADAETPFETRIARAVASEAEIVVAAGGDGTATALAAALIGTDKSLAVLPLGTANLLARDLGLPLDLEQAVRALAECEPRRIDVGEVNGQIFLHKVVIGLIPGIAAGREQLRGRTDLGAKVGFLRYFVRRLERAPRLAVAITSRDAVDRVERIRAIAVANNAYDEGFGRVFARQRLDGGTLSLYILKRLSVVDALRLGAAMALGHWRQDSALSIESVRSVTLQAKKPSATVMIDGELQNFEFPLRFRTRPLALSVLAPRRAEAAEDAAMAARPVGAA